MSSKTGKEITSGVHPVLKKDSGSQDTSRKEQKRPH